MLVVILKWAYMVVAFLLVLFLLLISERDEHRAEVLLIVSICVRRRLFSRSPKVFVAIISGNFLEAVLLRSIHREL